MLKSIDSQFYEPRKVRTDSLLSLLKIYHRFYLSFEAHDRATFLVAEDDKRGVYGGAVLYPQKISSSLDISSEDTREERLEKLFSAFQPKGQEYWKARLCLCIGHDTTTPLFEQIHLCQNFFGNLYYAFTVFGARKEIDYLAITLRLADTRVDNSLNILAYKNWPLLEVKPSGEPDGYFHGILSLKGNPFEQRKKNGNSSNLSPLNRTEFSSQNFSISEGEIE